MQLSPHFSLAELTVSDTAKRLGLNNVPSGIRLERLRETARQMEIVREILGGPILVTSGYRSPTVNKAVGGVSNSDHISAYAIDFTCPSFGSPYLVCAMIIASKVKFNQLIHERRKWVHISFDPKMRGDVLTLPVSGNKYLQGLVK